MHGCVMEPDEEELFTFGNTKKICIDAAKLDALSQVTRKAKEKKLFLEKSKGRKTVVATSVRNRANEESAEESDSDVASAVVEMDSPPLSPLFLSPPLHSFSTSPHSPTLSMSNPSTSAIKNLPVFLKADALVTMLRSPSVSDRDIDSHHVSLEPADAPQEVTTGLLSDHDQSFNLRVRLRGQIHKYPITQDTTLLEVCALLASERGCDPRQIFLSHRTSTLDLLSSVRDNSLTTADIVDAVVTDAVPEPQVTEMITCEVENSTCVFSIRSPTTSVDYSINKAEPISKAMCAFADSLGTPLSKIRFTFDGCTLDPEQTVLDLGLENGDIIDAEVVEKMRGKRLFTLPCIHMPSLLSAEVLNAIDCIQIRCEVVLTLLNRFGVPKALSEIYKTHGNPGTLQVTSFVDYLHMPGSSPFQGLEWFWENDHGQFSPYSSDVCSVLTREFQASPIGSATVTIGTNTFMIDFGSMLQFSVGTGAQRGVYYNDLTPCWYLKADNGEVTPFSVGDAGILEGAFKRYQPQQKPITLTIRGRKCSIDFVQMHSEDLDTKVCLQIERRTISRTDAVLSDSDLMFEVYGVETNIDEAFQEVSSLLQGRLVTLVLGHQQQSLPGSAYQQSVKTWAVQYFVHLSIAVVGHVSLTGVGGYAENVIIKWEEQMAMLANASSKYPTWWEPQVTKIELKVVAQSTPEWDKVVSLVHLTLGRAQMVQVERIQNQWLWDRYMFAKQRMAEKNGGEVNEKELFHGTRDTLPEKIYRSEQGFDFRYSAMGNWGTGTYFAVNASYSHNYAFKKKEGGKVVFQMLLAYVLTGMSYSSPPNSSLRRPPVRQSGPFEDQLYDSVQGNTGNSDVYVVYDHEKAYPAYILTYNMDPCACENCRGRAPSRGRRGRGRPRKK